MKSFWIWFTQVIVGTFFIEPKDTSAGIKGDVSASKLPSPVGEPASSLGFRPALDSSNGNTIRRSEEHQTFGGSHFMLQQCGLNTTASHPSDWGSCPDSRNASFELIGMNFDGFANASPLPPYQNFVFMVMFSVCRKNRSWSTPFSWEWGLFLIKMVFGSWERLFCGR